MSEIRVKEGESLESALRRFKRSTARSGVLAELSVRRSPRLPASASLSKVSYNERLCRFALRAGLHFYFIGATNRSLKKGHIYDFNPRIYL